VLRGQGVDPLRRYFFPVTGYNYRLTNLACAILCGQIERAEQMLERRRAIFAAYRERLQGIPGIGFQPVAPWAEPAPWLFCITVDEDAYGRSRDELMAWLSEQGIDTRPFFVPIHRLPPYREESLRRGEDLPHTDRLGASGINLPTYTRMTDENIGRVATAIRQGAR
jgi:perosamine synthetase